MSAGSLSDLQKAFVQSQVFGTLGYTTVCLCAPPRNSKQVFPETARLDESPEPCSVLTQTELKQPKEELKTRKQSWEHRAGWLGRTSATPVLSLSYYVAEDHFL